MAAEPTRLGDTYIQGDLTLAGTFTPGLSRSNLVQATERFKLNPTDWRVWDAFATNLPATSASDDLGLYGGTFATSAPIIATGDVKASTVTRYARITFPLPCSYVAGQVVTIRAYAGMGTTVADTSATVDFQAYRSGDDTTIGSDLVTTAAQSMNSLTEANRDFVVTPTSLLPGDMLDIRMTIAVVDSATATAVVAQVTVEILLATKG